MRCECFWLAVGHAVIGLVSGGIGVASVWIAGSEAALGWSLMSAVRFVMGLFMVVTGLVSLSIGEDLFVDWWDLKRRI